MNAPIRVRSYADPWDIDVANLPHVAPEDHFRDAYAEEAVLSQMLWKNQQSKRLGPQHFTGHDRPLIFIAIQEGAPFETIERLELQQPGYVADLFFAPSNAPNYLREAVATLVRLAELRELNERVKAWQKRAPHVDVRKARAMLAEVLR